jgi:uncharacterized protein YtpQ (UPF0354 family)
MKYILIAVAVLFAIWLLFAIIRVASTVKSGELQEKLDEKRAARQQSRATDEITFTANQIVPRIKNTAFLDALRQNDVPDEQLPVYQEIAGGLIATYAFETDDAFIAATPPLIASSIGQTDSLSELAFKNLKRQLTNVRLGAIGQNDTSDTNVFSISAGNHMEPCFLLSNNFWNGKSTEFAGEPVAAVPNRDTLLFCDSHSKQSIDALRELTNNHYDPNETHSLSKRLLVWRNNQWHEFEE